MEIESLFTNSDLRYLDPTNMLFANDPPPEIVLTILSYLPLQSLHALRRLNHEWLSWFDLNQSYIYQHAALKHNFIYSEDISLQNAVLTSKHLLPNDTPVDEWRAFCKLWFLHPHSREVMNRSCDMILNTEYFYSRQVNFDTALRLSGPA